MPESLTPVSACMFIALVGGGALALRVLASGRARGRPVTRPTIWPRPTGVKGKTLDANGDLPGFGIRAGRGGNYMPTDGGEFRGIPAWPGVDTRRLVVT